MTFDGVEIPPSLQEHPFPGMIGGRSIIKLFERDRPASEVILPVTPAELPEEGASSTRDFKVIGAGSHSAPAGREPRSWTLEGTFYGGPRVGKISQLFDWRPPQDCVAQIRGWVNRMTLLHLQAYGRAGALDVPCFVNSYTFTRSGWAGDVKFSVKVTEWRPLRVAIDDGSDSSQAVALADDEQAAGADDEPTDEPVPLSYTVVPGDSLWLIAKAMLGDTGRWPEVYELNRELIGDNPNLIYPGQELTIPGGHVETEGDEAL